MCQSRILTQEICDGWKYDRKSNYKYNIYQGVAHGPVPGVLDGTVEEGGALSLHRHVVREPGGELRHQLPRPGHGQGSEEGRRDNFSRYSHCQIFAGLGLVGGAVGRHQVEN